MNSTLGQLQIQIPQLPRPDESTDYPPGSGSISASTTSNRPDHSPRPSPRSDFCFTWTSAAEQVVAFAPHYRSSSSPSSSPGNPYSYSSQLCQVVGPSTGTSRTPRTLAVAAAVATGPASAATATGTSPPPPPPPPPPRSPCLLPAAPISGLAPSIPAQISVNATTFRQFPSSTSGLKFGTAGAPTASRASASLSASPTGVSPGTTNSFVKMPARPGKRSADGGALSDDDASVTGNGKAKLARSDRGLEDFSSVVKHRLQSYSRTGQACDRCKVRKIRCDALPEGCSHCINLNLECYVTDRVTGRTERRGYMQQLERERKSMLSHIRDLEHLCNERGVVVKSWQPDNRSSQSPLRAAVDDSADSRLSMDSTESWSRYRSLWIKETAVFGPMNKASASSVPRGEWQTRPDQAHWGVNGDAQPLSSLKGTTLTLLGATIETTAFDAPDVDEPPTDVDPSMPLYNKSVQSFLRSTMGVNPVPPVDLPSRADAFMYAEWYFISVAPFMPILHKPTFLGLLTRVYDEPGFKPSIPQQVQIHMVLANIMFQFGVRNSQTTEQRNNFNDLSNKHYHFALSKMYDIFSSPKFEAFQGLVLLATHTRGFPKPGCGSIVACMTLHRALELNLHRNAKRPGEPTDLQNELRKRAWWCTLAIVVAISGKRGNHVPISVQDFDVDYPEPIADELLSEEGVDTSRTLPCPYELAICGFKLVPTLMEMYAHVCSLRRDPSNYKSVLSALEAQLELWEAELPDSMRLSTPRGQDHEMIGPLYVRTYALEFRLQIRHPSLAMTTDRDMIAENTNICKQAAREYLEAVESLSKMKALDTTWYQMTVYCVSILSLLVPQWQRRYEVTHEDFVQLESEMDRWMNIVKEMSTLLGCGNGMNNQIRSLIDRTLNWIKHDMDQKELERASHDAIRIKQEKPHLIPSSVPQPLPERHPANQTIPFTITSRQPPISPISPISPIDGGDPLKTFYHTNCASSSHDTYSPIPYAEQPAASGSNSSASYQHQQPSLYNASTATTDHQVAFGPSDAMANYGPSIGHQSPDVMWRNTWSNWTAAIADSQARYSANALMTLGNSGGGRSSMVAPIIADNGVTGTPGGELPLMPQSTPWPLVIFDQPHD